MEDSLFVRKLNEQLNELQMSFDSLKHSSSVNQLTYELHQKQDVISQVNDFYDSAWLKLIIVISVLGVIVPIIAQYFQRKNLTDLTEFIRKQMNENFEAKILELKTYNAQEIEKALSELKSNIASIESKNKNIYNELDASTYYLQGRATFIDKKYVLAVNSFFRSAYCYLQTDRPERANVQFVNIKLCLKAIKFKSDLDKINSDLQKSTLKMTFEETIDFFKVHALKDLYELELLKSIAEVERIKNGI